MSVKLRAINKKRQESKTIYINDASKFERTRMWAKKAGFDLYLVLAQKNKYQYGLVFDFDAHDNKKSLGEAYESYINAERYYKKAKYKISGIFTGRGFQLRVFTTPFRMNKKIRAHYEEMTLKFDADSNFAHNDNNLMRCPLTFNQKAKKWVIPFNAPAKLKEILFFSRLKPTPDFNYLNRYANGITTKKPPVPPPKLKMQEEQNLITKEQFLYILKRENWRCNETGSLVKCPLAHEHKNREQNHLSATLLTMRDNTVRIFCHKSKDKRFKRHIFNIFNFYYYAFGMKYNEARKRIFELIREYEEIKTKQEVLRDGR